MPSENLLGEILGKTQLLEELLMELNSLTNSRTTYQKTACGKSALEERFKELLEKFWRELPEK